MSTTAVELPYQTPIEYESRPPRGIFWVMCGCAFVFGGPGVLSLIATLTSNETGESFVVGIVIGAIFSLFGILFLVFAHGAHRFRDTILITPHQVARQRQLLFGEDAWTEPTSHYRGVLMHDELDSVPARDRSRASKEVHRFSITLKHRDDGDRDIVLYRSTSSDGHRGKALAYAQSIERPLLTLGAGGAYNQVPPEHTNQPLNQQLTGRPISASMNPYKPMSEDRLQVETTPTGIRFTFGLQNNQSFSIWLLFVGMTLAGNYFFGWVDLDLNASWYAGLVAVFCAVGGLGLLIANGLRHVLQVTPDKLETRAEIYGKRVSRRIISGDNIVSVDIEKDRRGYEVLVIRTANRSLRYAALTDAASRKYVREQVIAILASRRKNRSQTHGLQNLQN